MDISLNLEMSLSREEFLRLLPGAVGLAAVVEEGGVFRGFEGPRRWAIRPIPLVDLRLGSVNLSRHRIEIRLEGYSDGEAEAYMVRFHRGFQRGGG